MSKKDKSSRVKLIVNPNAGNASESKDRLELVLQVLKEKGLKVDVAFAKPKSKATLIAKRTIKNGYRTVVAMGGDGTVEAVMRGMVGSKARLGLIASGTENNIAKSLGIPEDLQEACTLIASNSTLKMDVGAVKMRNGKTFHFLEMVTLGISATVYPHANKVVHGKLSRLVTAVKTFLEQESSPKVLLTLDRESKVEVETMMVMVSNTPILGVNFLVAPQASLQDGRLEISVYPGFSKVELLRYYTEIRNGGYSGNQKVQEYQAGRVKIKASPKLDIMADGVSLGSGTVVIKILPGALRVIASETHLGSEIPGSVETEEQAESVSIAVGENHPQEAEVSSR